MSITVRPSAERGSADHGWLRTRFSFSFAEYRDPAHRGFRSLRVLNDDRVAGGAGFPRHPHANMEIITYVVEGAVAHEDSTGARGVTVAGEVQHMTAGRGVTHSEFNASPDEELRLLQIWVLPDQAGLEPGYAQRAVGDDEKRDRLALVASPDPADGVLTIHQDARMLATLLTPGAEVVHPLGPGRHAWVQVVTGDVELNGVPLAEGDGAALSAESAVRLVGRTEAEVVLFDLA